MNSAHQESLELLEIVHKLCMQRDIKYTIFGESLIEYEYNMEFDKSVPIVYIALLCDEFKILSDELKKYVKEHVEYSYHDHENTSQMNAFESWFVKESKIVFSEKRKKESFYYGTRLVIVPIFFAGDNEGEWLSAYNLFRETIYTLNARAVLRGKPLKSYIRLTPKRRLSNHYIKLRQVYTYERCVQAFSGRNRTQYTICPFVVERDKKDPNSVPQMVNDNIKLLLSDDWADVEEISFYGIQSYCIKKRKELIQSFPEYYIKGVLDPNKSQLALNGNTYLWRVQQIQIELLQEFDRICRKYGINYNISFGTLLGAVRHGGFIPWDDDIDVTVMAEDYNKLDEIMEKELDSDKYYFRSPLNEKNNHLIFKHLERKGTVYTKPGRNKLEKTIGVFIDIFPMYPSAHLAVVDWFHARICRYWRTALWATIGADSEKDEKKRKKYKKMAKPGNTVCYAKFVRAAQFFRNKKYLKFWIAMDRNPYKVPLVRVENYTETIDIEFEGHKFMTSSHYEDVLDYCFGHDWRMYPSTRGRMPAHNAIMDIGDLYLKESEGNV